MDGIIRLLLALDFLELSAALREEGSLLEIFWELTLQIFFSSFSFYPCSHLSLLLFTFEIYHSFRVSPQKRDFSWKSEGKLSFCVVSDLVGNPDIVCQAENPVLFIKESGHKTSVHTMAFTVNIPYDWLYVDCRVYISFKYVIKFLIPPFPVT